MREIKYFNLFLFSSLVIQVQVAVAFVSPFSSPQFRSKIPLQYKFTKRSIPCSILSMRNTEIEADTTEKVKIKKSRVQRTYETFEWRYSTTTEHQDKKDQRLLKINYRVEGPKDGPPILLVHGFGYQFPVLVEEGYRVYAIDLLGFGASEKPKDIDFSIEMWTDLLVDFMQSMNTESENNGWVITGNSLGGLCSLNVCKRIGESGLDNLVRGCVLFNTSGGMSVFRYEDVPFLLRPVLYFMQNVVLGPSFGGQYFENFRTKENVRQILTAGGVYRDTTNVDEELLEILLEPGEDENAKDVFLKVFAGDPGPTPKSMLPKIKTPILSLWGSDDPWTPIDKGPHCGESFHQYIDTSQSSYTLIPIVDSGHCPHDEAPDQCHEHLLPWLRQLP